MSNGIMSDDERYEAALGVMGSGAVVYVFFEGKARRLADLPEPLRMAAMIGVARGEARLLGAVS